MTYKQASDNGWQVRGGEKGTQIEYWEVKRAADKAEASPSARDAGGKVSPGANSDARNSQLVHRVYTVFNAQQIERIPPHTPKQPTTFEAVQAGEQILKNSGANIALTSTARLERSSAIRTKSSARLMTPPRPPTSFWGWNATSRSASKSS
jgi:antirestriction protein ArdC